MKKKTEITILEIKKIARKLEKYDYDRFGELHPDFIDTLLRLIENPYWEEEFEEFQ